MPWNDGGRGRGRVAKPSLSTLSGGGLSDRALKSGDDGDCDSATFKISTLLCNQIVGRHHPERGIVACIVQRTTRLCFRQD